MLALWVGHQRCRLVRAILGCGWFITGRVSVYLSMYDMFVIGKKNSKIEQQ